MGTKRHMLCVCNNRWQSHSSDTYWGLVVTDWPVPLIPCLFIIQFNSILLNVIRTHVRGLYPSSSLIVHHSSSVYKCSSSTALLCHAFDDYCTRYIVVLSLWLAILPLRLFLLWRVVSYNRTKSKGPTRRRWQRRKRSSNSNSNINNNSNNNSINNSSRRRKRLCRDLFVFFLFLSKKKKSKINTLWSGYYILNQINDM